MINIVITSYNEPKSTLRAVNVFLKQNIKEEFQIIVVDPFEETEEFLDKNIEEKYKDKVHFFLDPGEGKSYALNILIQEYSRGNKDDIFIFTDGDVYVSDNTVSEIVKAFKDEKIGCITGKPVVINPKDNKYHYWSYVAFNAIHRFRSNLSKDNQFLQCSGYLFAMRDGVVLDFPFEVPEDCIIPYLLWKKGYKIKYLENIEVYVKTPHNWSDYKNQKIRTIKAHENLDKMVPDMPRTKSLFNEIKQGIFYALTQPKSFKEFYWIIQFYPARLYIYFKSFLDMKTNKEFKDGWRETEIESTKPLD